MADNNVRHGEYKQLANIAAGFWSEASAAGIEVVPTAMTGWDRRPRVLNPVPWERGRFSEEQMERYFAPPTATELEAHVAAAVRWAARPGAGASVLIYAWNEFDEGGWLAPTLGEGGSRLDAVRRGINAACAAPVKVQ